MTHSGHSRSRSVPHSPDSINGTEDRMTRLSRSYSYLPTVTITSHTENFSDDSEAYNNLPSPRTSTFQVSLPPHKGRKRNPMSLSPLYSQGTGYSYATSSARGERGASVSTGGGTAAASSSSSGVLMKNRTDARTRSSPGSGSVSSLGSSSSSGGGNGAGFF